MRQVQAGTNHQDVTVFEPGSDVHIFSIVQWERGRRTHDRDNVIASLKAGFDYLQHQNYIDNDRNLLSYPPRLVRDPEGIGNILWILTGRANPELPASHPCHRLPLGVDVWFPGNRAYTVAAHRPGAVLDVYLANEKEGVWCSVGALLTP